MSQHLPTGNFKWMTDKEISKIDLGKYKADGKKGLILEVDLEYPQELHDIHNDYPVALEKVKVSNNMLSAYCKKIAEKYNISISWLTVSSQIVKSLSLPYKKFYFFNMVQPIDLIFCKMVDIIEQNIFNRADFLFRS